MSEGSEGDDPFARSMTDLMAGVAVTFLIIAAIFMVRASRETKSAQQSAKVNEEQAKELQLLKGENHQVIEDLAKLADELDPKKLADVGALDETRIDPNDPFALTLVLKRRSVKFASGQCDLDSSADDALLALERSVLPRVCKAVQDGLVQTIALEGHTDNRGFFPASPTCGVERTSGCGPDSKDAPCVLQGFENNVRLSGARAEDVFFRVDHLIHAESTGADAGVDVTFLTRCLEDHFTIAGRGPVEPVATPSWHDPQDDAARDANRRVVIKLRAMAKPPTLDLANK